MRWKSPCVAIYTWITCLYVTRRKRQKLFSRDYVIHLWNPDALTQMKWHGNSEKREKWTTQRKLYSFPRSLRWARSTSATASLNTDGVSMHLRGASGLDGAQMLFCHIYCTLYPLRIWNSNRSIRHWIRSLPLSREFMCQHFAGHFWGLNHEIGQGTVRYFAGSALRFGELLLSTGTYRIYIAFWNRNRQGKLLHMQIYCLTKPYQNLHWRQASVYCEPSKLHLWLLSDGNALDCQTNAFVSSMLTS